MTISYEDQKTNEGRLRGIARAVASRLGGRWALEKRERDYTHYAEIEDGFTGARLGFSTSEGKIHISGQFVTTIEGRHVFYRTIADPNVSIGVGINRGVDIMAREIARRLLPAYLPEWQKNLEAVNRFHKHNEVTGTIARRMAKLIGAEEAPVTDHRVSVRVYNSRELRGDVFDLSVQGDSVRFDNLDVDEATAIKILDVLMAARQAKSDG